MKIKDLPSAHARYPAGYKTDYLTYMNEIHEKFSSLAVYDAYPELKLRFNSCHLVCVLPLLVYGISSHGNEKPLE